MVLMRVYAGCSMVLSPDHPRYGATLVSANAGDAESQPGVVAVVIREGFAGYCRGNPSTGICRS